jgi:hypothetical protein
VRGNIEGINIYFSLRKREIERDFPRVILSEQRISISSPVILRESFPRRKDDRRISVERWVNVGTDLQVCPLWTGLKTYPYMS